MKPKKQRTYKGLGNRHNRFKRDSKKLTNYERNGFPAGFRGFRWND